MKSIVRSVKRGRESLVINVILVGLLCIGCVGYLEYKREFVGSKVL